MNSILVFVITFVVFMAVWIIALLIGRAINKKKLGNFRKYIEEHLPEIDPEKEQILIAKQKSKQVSPNIALLMPKNNDQILILVDEKGSGITLKRFSYSDLKAVRSLDQVLSRGFFPKTYSYEEALQMDFNDGSSYQMVLENISNKQGNDQGADIVRGMFAPWRRKLNEILAA
jgi:ABC-type lipoprotein release transport system permease subunit